VALGEPAFVHQVSTGAGIQPLTPEHIELQWRAAAECARREIKIAAERHGTGWSFEVARRRISSGRWVVPGIDFKGRLTPIPWACPSQWGDRTWTTGFAFIGLSFLASFCCV